MEQTCNKPGTVVPFPASRQEALIRDIVQVLLKRHGAAADRFWGTTVNRLIGQMQVSGILDEAEIRQQVEAFSLVVFDRIRAAAGPAIDQVEGSKP
ncbi:DUF6074 family protein [Aminobacter sp. NyZ550]|uniref:DUF6074 family protein n=1 Tax=Aminobacter sp. NyZ550 TaxID=2979870 RepID=UPI0021D5E7C0|nr:DUF6074 family protein [Aminobacter sp. NyZ550]WAX97971.1 DUF6074 family protein [Aminobacter sp. NyZ550]